MRVLLAIFPGAFILILTLAFSLAIGDPEDLFLASSAMDILLRFALVTLILAAPISILPKFLVLSGELSKHDGVFGQLVKPKVKADQKLSKAVMWIIRPFQGIAVSLILAERFLSFLELSIGSSYAVLLAQSALFVVGGALTSLFLSLVWGLDDLGVKIYNKKTGEVRIAGNYIGTILPLITGAIGLSSVFRTSTPTAALLNLLGIVMVLYPSYVSFVICHQEFIRRRRDTLSEKIITREIETKVW